jgi:hypothetical protein
MKEIMNINFRTGSLKISVRDLRDVFANENCYPSEPLTGIDVYKTNHVIKINVDEYQNFGNRFGLNYSQFYA